jgi:hypothetical protein
VCPRLLAELEEVARRPKIADLIAADAARRFVTDVRGGSRVELQREPRTRALGVRQSFGTFIDCRVKK